MTLYHAISQRAFAAGFALMLSAVAFATAIVPASPAGVFA